MRLIALIAAIVWLAGCGKHTATHPGGTPNEVVQGLYDTYSALSPSGWYDGDCDGLLFKSLRNAATKTVFPIELARNDVGKWYRDQDHSHCVATSRDMHYGLWFYAAVMHRADLVDQDWDYAVAHVYVMDDRDPTISTLFIPDDLPTLALTEHKLGGHEHEAWKVPTTCIKGLSGFTGHLQMVKIALRGLIQAGNTRDAECAADYAAKSPHNAFYTAVNGLYTGDQAPAEALLSANTVCPLTRLPTSADRCDQWIYQRNEDTAAWQPCPAEGVTHNGGDCLLAAAIALGRLQ